MYAVCSHGDRVGFLLLEILVVAIIQHYSQQVWLLWGLHQHPCSSIVYSNMIAQPHEHDDSL